VANGRSGQRDPDVEPRAVTASGDPDKQDRDVADAPRYGNTTGHWQEQPRSGTGAQTEGRSGVGPADADSG
jgi:hypothetical protein